MKKPSIQLLILVRPLLCAAVLLAVIGTARADVLELRNGKIIRGTYVGGTATTVRFETAKGVQLYRTVEILALTFTGGKAPASKTSSVKKQSTPSYVNPYPAQITVPSGTRLLVRMSDRVSSNDAAGRRFTATLESDLAADGTVVAKAGSLVYGRVEYANQAGRYAGRSMLDLRLTDLAVGGRTVPIVTGSYTETGSQSLGKTAKGALAGTAIGAIAAGHEGVGTGAAIGAVASGLKRGESVEIGPGELLEFRLQQPLSVAAQK